MSLQVSIIAEVNPENAALKPEFSGLPGALLGVGLLMRCWRVLVLLAVRL